MTTRWSYILSFILAITPLLPQVRYDCRMSGRQAMTVCCCSGNGCCADGRRSVEVEGESEQAPSCCPSDGNEESSRAPCSPQSNEDEGTTDEFVPTDCQCCDVRLAASQIAAVADSKPAKQATERIVVHLLAIPPPLTHDLIAFHDTGRFRPLLMRTAGCPLERSLYLRHCALLI